MTPLTTALLVFLVVVGMWAYGKYTQSYLEKSYSFAVGRAEELSKIVAEQNMKIGRLKEIEKTSAGNDAKINSLQTSLDQASQKSTDLQRELEKKDHANKLELKKLSESYVAQLNEARKNADAELKKQIGRLQAERTAWDVDRNRLTLENSKLRPLADQVPGLQLAIRGANATIDRQISDSTRMLTELTTVKTELVALNALLWGTVTNLKVGLLTTGETYLGYYQQDFRTKFNNQLRASPDIYNKYGYGSL